MPLARAFAAETKAALPEAKAAVPEDKALEPTTRAALPDARAVAAFEIPKLPEERKKYRAFLNKKNREAGTYGNGDGKDYDHDEKRMISHIRNRSKK